jgi:hypothetical protein
MSTTKLKDSGERRDAGTGSVRDKAAGKGRMDLLPLFALEEIAKHFEDGAVKYGDNNWKKGQPLSWYSDSAMRHLMKAMRGQTDEPHFRAAVWNIMCLIETRKMVALGMLPKSLDDIPDLPKEIQDKL